MRLRKAHVTQSSFMYYKQPVMLVEGNMQYLYDHTGKRYLDCCSGIATVGVGHSHPRVNAKIIEALNKIQHNPTIYLNDQ